MKSILESIQLYYHVIVSLTMFMCSTIVFSFWLRKKALNGTAKNGILFLGMILLTWALSSMGHLVSKLFPEEGKDANLLSSIFRVMSLFNNLFIFLTLPYLGLFRRFRNDRFNFNISVVAIIVVMLSFILDRVSVGNTNIGAILVALIDTIFSAPIIVLFGYALNLYWQKANPEIRLIRLYNILATAVLFLVVMGSMAMLLFNLYENKAVVQNFYIVYFVHYPAMLYITIIIMLISYRMYTQPDRDLGWLEDSSLTSNMYGNTLANEQSALLHAANPVEIIPKSILFDYQSEKQQFLITLKCHANEQEVTYQWSGNNCTYPYFYWLYLSAALRHDIEVEIKDSQVTRNRMLRMFDSHLSPRLFVHLNGSVASLNIPADQIFINPILLQHNAVRIKFKENITPFLVLTTYDVKMYAQNRGYKDEIFESVYKLLF